MRLREFIYDCLFPLALTSSICAAITLNSCNDSKAEKRITVLEEIIAKQLGLTAEQIRGIKVK